MRIRFTELDGLRGLAALAVVAFHLRDFILRQDPPGVVGEIVGGGYLMVDLFFVLSGFVLSRKMLATATAGDVRRFALMRVRRFAPLHVTAWSIALLLVTATAVMQAFGVQHAPHRPAFDHASDRPWAWVSGLFLLHGFVGPEFSGYSAAWSLSVELYLNVVLVAAISLLATARRKRLVGPATTVAGAVLLLLAHRNAPNTIGLIGIGRGLYGLGLGMVTYQLYLAVVHRLQRRHGTASTRASRLTAGLVAGALLPVMVASMYRSDIIKHGHFLGIGLISGLVVLALALPSGGPAHRLFNSRVAQWLGTRSFALYALHGPTLGGVQFCVLYLGYHRYHPRVALLVVVVTVLGALVAADVGHRVVERSWEQRVARRRRHRSAPPDASPETLEIPQLDVDATGARDTGAFRYQPRRPVDDTYQQRRPADDAPRPRRP